MKIDFAGVRDFIFLKKDKLGISNKKAFLYYGFTEREAHELLDDYYAFIGEHSREITNSAIATAHAIDFIDKRGLNNMQALYILTAAIFEVGYIVGMQNMRDGIMVHVNAVKNILMLGRNEEE